MDGISNTWHIKKARNIEKQRKMCKTSQIVSILNWKFKCGETISLVFIRILNNLWLGKITISSTCFTTRVNFKVTFQVKREILKTPVTKEIQEKQAEENSKEFIWNSVFKCMICWFIICYIRKQNAIITNTEEFFWFWTQTAFRITSWFFNWTI